MAGKLGHHTLNMGYFYLSLFFILTILSPTAFLSAFENDGDSIPHYKQYPRTKVFDYQDKILDFYSVKEDYGEFSNFALFPLLIDGLLWPSSEHYYQSQKFLDPVIQESIRNAPSPYWAAKMAREPQMPVREDWDIVKDEIMEKVVRIKFLSYGELRELLLSTNAAEIYEHTKLDCYWADCLDRTGQNKLGHIISKIRDELRRSLPIKSQECQRM